MEEKFERLDSELIERTVNEWGRALSKLLKTLLLQYSKPMQLLTFLERALEKFKVRFFVVTQCSHSCQ